MDGDILNPNVLPSYYVLVTAKDEIKYIRRTLESVLVQTHKPGLVIMHDDGSTDGTYEVMLEYKQKYKAAGIWAIVKETHSKDRSFAHIPKIYNQNWIPGYDFILWLGGDIELEPEYAMKNLRVLKHIPGMVITSGDYAPFVASSPHGAGRFMRMSWFWEEYKGRCSESIVHESEFLHRANMTGRQILVIRDAHFNHLKPLGTDHNFKEFGHASRALGYDWLFMLLASWQARKNPLMGPRGAFNMLMSYLTFRPKKTGYHTLAPADVRAHCKAETRKQFDAMFALEKQNVLSKLGLVPPPRKYVRVG